MSRSELYLFRKDGEAFPQEEFRNGWGSAPRVWGALIHKHKFEMYPGKTPKELEFVNAISNAEDLWTLAEKKAFTLTWWELNLLRWTYDNAVLRREDFPLMIASILEFEKAYPAGDRVNHLPRIREVLEAVAEDPEILGTGYYHTSIVDNPWTVYNSETDESRPYNLNTDTKHHFIEMTATPKSALDHLLEDSPV